MRTLNELSLTSIVQQPPGFMLGSGKGWCGVLVPWRDRVELTLLGNLIADIDGSPCGDSDVGPEVDGPSRGPGSCLDPTELLEMLQSEELEPQEHFNEFPDLESTMTLLQGILKSLPLTAQS